MTYQKDIIQDIAAAGLRDKVKILVGGAPLTAEFANDIGADAYSRDAAEASEVALRFLNEMKGW